MQVHKHYPSWVKIAVRYAPTRRHLIPAIVAVLLALIVVPLYLSRKPPTEFMSFYIATPYVGLGEKLKIVYGYRLSSQSCESTIYASIYDNTERVRMFEGPLNISVDVPEDNGPEVYSGMSKYIGIPVHAHEGGASLQTEIEHRCNWLHWYWPIVQELPSQPFTIGPKPDVQILEKKIEQLQEQNGIIPTPNAPSPLNVPSAGPFKVPKELVTPDGQPTPQSGEFVPMMPLPLDVFGPPPPERKMAPLRRNTNVVRRRKDRSATKSQTTFTSQIISVPVPAPAPAPAPQATSVPPAAATPTPEYVEEELPGWAKAIIGR
jgi:hypothetical protein